MNLLRKAALAAILMGGAAAGLPIPATAQTADPYGGYYDADPYGPPPPPDYGPPPPPPYYGPPPPAYGYYPAYGDPYACDAYDYYNPPWGYPPDYCNYNVWYEPIYIGGLWYSGPIYYRDFGGERRFWLNGGWHRDEWRGARPGRIDWSRNMRWTGGPERGRSFAGPNVLRGNYGGIARGNYGANAPHFAPQDGGFRGYAGGGVPHAFAQGQANHGFRGFGGGGGFRGGQGGGGFRGGPGGGGFRGGQGRPAGGGGHAQSGGGGHGGGGHHHG